MSIYHLHSMNTCARTQVAKHLIEECKQGPSQQCLKVSNMSSVKCGKGRCFEAGITPVVGVCSGANGWTVAKESLVEEVFLRTLIRCSRIIMK